MIKNIIIKLLITSITLLNNDNYILTIKEEVYYILDYTYLSIDNINNYLSYSKLIDDKYRAYLKNIILDSNA